MPASDHSRWWLAAEAVLALALVALPWSFGGAPAWSLWLVVAFGAVSLLLWTIGASKNHRRWGPNLLLALPAAAIAVALVQLLPLPPGLQSMLSPPGFELREFALVPLGLDRWRPISLDAPSTARALARAIGLGSMALVALELGRQAHVRRRLLVVLALSGVSVAVCGFGHLLANADSLFGAYHFRTAVQLMTPFGNANHLAAWLTLSGTVALGLALDAKSRDETIGWVAAAFACGVAVFLSYSRGGIGTFVATWGLVGAAVLARRGGGIRSVLPWVAIAATIAFAGLLSFEQLLARADTVSSVDKLRATKVEFWPMFARGAAAFWPAGLGLGAYELGFGRYQDQQLSVTFTHPENLPLQWATEAGLPATLALAAVVVSLFVRARRRTWELPLERTAMIAVAGVFLHDLFDFSLELNALATGVAITAGLVCAVGREQGGRLAVRRVGPVVAVVATAAAVVSGLGGSPSHEQQEERLAGAIASGQTVAQVRAIAVAAIDRHPADWVLYANMASELARRGQPAEALAWVNRLLFLRPSDARAHVAAAQALLRLGHPRQALIELKTAWSLGDDRSLELGVDVAAREHAFDRILLDTRGHLTKLYRVLRAKDRVEEAVALLDAAEQAPMSEDARAELRVLRVLHAAELGDPSEALARWAELPEDERRRAELVMVRVQALGKLGRVDEAAAELERLCNREPGNAEAAFALAGLLESTRKLAAARQVLGRIRSLATSQDVRARTFQVEARTWMTEERWPRALDALQTASRIEPARADLHYRMAEVYERMGSLHSALDEVRRGRLLDTPEGAKAQDSWVQRLEKAQAVMP
ncbi:MAG: tetratricopeptide repeat protein [Myxococcota bacterium]